MAHIRRPHLIGLRSLDGLASFDFDREALELYDARDESMEATKAQRSTAFEELIHTFEAIRATQPRSDVEPAEIPGPA